MAPEHIGQYRIVRSIGAGGGGDVYEAFDSKLNRSVALKIVRGERKVLEEARALSALDHPNILTVHDVGDADGHAFVVTELVRGRTLREVLAHERLNRETALDFAIQIARGLAAAHGAGIVHRDLKPENVMITEDGIVKILDFGLAQTSSRDSEAETAELDGSGTPGYTSPEQSEGRGADARTDVFAFGAILYELVTGSPAFHGETAAQRSTSVLRDEPELRGEPDELAKLVSRCLRKDPERRFQSLADVPMLLVDIRAELATPRHRTRWGWLAAALVLGALTALLMRRDVEPVSITPITSFRGAERDPAISPDGTWIAFVWEGENWDGKGEEEGMFPGLYVKLLDQTSVPLRIADHAHGPTFSPDGQRIAYLEHRDDLEWHDVRIIPILGGEAETLGQTFGTDHQLSWSPDASTLALVHRASRTAREAIFLLALESGELRRLTSPAGEAYDGSPRFSPNGTTVAIRRSEGTTHELYLVDVAGGEPRRVDGAGERAGSYDWSSDGRSIVYRNGDQLLRVDVPNGRAEPLRFPVAVDMTQFVVAGERVFYREARDDADLWRSPGPLATESAPPERFIHSTLAEYQPAYDPDGEHIAFVSHRTGAQQIWVCRSDGKDCRALTEGAGDKQMPKWSPDGKSIVFISVDSDRMDSYLVPASGGIPRKLTDAERSGGAWSWSHDGRHLYYMSEHTERDGDYQIWKLNLDSGETLQITEDSGHMPWESEDGRYVYYKTRRGRSELWRASANGGSEELFIERSIAGELFALWNNKIFFRDWDETRGELYLMLDLETREETEVFAVGPETPGVHFGRMTISPDGQFIVYTRGEIDNGDIMLAENLLR